jgi:hypothetical protein
MKRRLIIMALLVAMLAGSVIAAYSQVNVEIVVPGK